MNLEQLQKELAADEGCKLEIYLDHLGYPTVGIGHLIHEDDDLHGLEVGSEVSQELVDELFHDDVQRTLRDCEFLYSDFNDLPEDAQLIIRPTSPIWLQKNEGSSRFEGLPRGQPSDVGLEMG